MVTQVGRDPWKAFSLHPIPCLDLFYNSHKKLLNAFRDGEITTTFLWKSMKCEKTKPASTLLSIAPS